MQQRRAVRALLVDPGGAVLLMQVTNPADGRTWWITPGGGVDGGESPAEALCRELHEEIALEIESRHIGARVWTRSHVFTWDDRSYDQTEDFFLVETDRFTPTHCADGDPGAMVDCPHRWWTPGEIASSADEFAPSRLAEALRILLAHGPPAEPYDVGS